jgi:hypothetical protein
MLQRARHVISRLSPFCYREKENSLPPSSPAGSIYGDLSLVGKSSSGPDVALMPGAVWGVGKAGAVGLGAVSELSPMFPAAAGSIVVAGACDPVGVSRAGAEAAVVVFTSVGVIGLEGACTGIDAAVS